MNEILKVTVIAGSTIKEAQLKYTVVFTQFKTLYINKMLQISFTIKTTTQ